MKKLKDTKIAIYGYGIFETFLAWRLAQDVKDVILFRPWMGPFPRPHEQFVGKVPWIRRADSWEDTKAEILKDEGIFCFFDVGDGDKQLELRKQGARVFGAGESGELEMNRKLFKETLKSRGLPVPQYGVITGIDNLEKLLRKEKDLWIKLDTEMRGIMETCYHASWETSKDWFYKLAHDLICFRDMANFMWEKPIPGVEPGTDFFISKGIPFSEGLYGWEEKGDGYVCRHMNIENMPSPIKRVHTAMLPVRKKYGTSGAVSSEIRIGEDKQPYFIDACYSEDTEILTDAGWKFFNDLNIHDVVCTLNAKTNGIEYQAPTDYIARKYKGKMISISNRDKDIECLVTPNHGVWRTDRHGNGLYREEAALLKDKGYIPRTGIWKGETPKYFTLPEYHNNWTSGKSGTVYKEKHCPELKIPVKPWLQFLALYLSDGSLSSHKYSVSIAQWDRKPEYKKILSQLPFEIVDCDDGFRIHSVQLAKYLKQFGVCNEKFIPYWIKQLSPELLSVFLDTYTIADGNVHKGQRQYFTTSKQLADDIQEMCFKAGRLANVRRGNQAGTFMTAKNRTYKRNFDVYLISERPKQIRYWFETGARKHLYINEVDYDGFVYDVTVPNSIVYVRRNGKPFWSSNCERMGNPPAACISNIYKNFSQIVAGIADGIAVKPEWNAEYAAELTIDYPCADSDSVAMPLSDKDLESIKLRCACKIGDIFYNIPFKEVGNTIAKAVGLGNTREEAEFNALQAADKFTDKVKGSFYNKSTFDDLEGKIQGAVKYGLDPNKF